MYHLHAQVVKRSAGRSAIAMAAYRSGTALVDEETGEVKDYTAKSKIFGSEILAPDFAPTWATSRQQLWNRAEGAEKRKDAQLAREIDIALPADLNYRQMMGLTRDYVQSQFVNAGMIADVAWHNLSGDNPHAHIMLTTRQLEGEDFGPKNRAWNDRDQLNAWRKAWQDHANDALTAAGSKARIDHRSYEAQGIDKIPTKHLGPTATAMEDRGVKTERGDINRAIKARNDELMIDQARLATVENKIRLRKMEIRDEQRIDNLIRQASRPCQTMAMVEPPPLPAPKAPAPTKGFFSALKPKAAAAKPAPAPMPQEPSGAQRIAELVELLKTSRVAEWSERQLIEEKIIAEQKNAEKVLAEKVATLESRLANHLQNKPQERNNGWFGTNIYFPHHVKKEERQRQEWEDRGADLRQIVRNADEKLWSLKQKHKHADVGIPAESQWRQSHREELARRDEIKKELEKVMRKEGYTYEQQSNTLAGRGKDERSPYELEMERKQQEASKPPVMDWSVAVADPSVAKAMKSTAEDKPKDDPEPESYPSPGM